MTKGVEVAGQRVLVAFGTRPEAVKLAPVIAELKRSSELEPVVVVTAQHREMLDQVNETFGIVPDVDLDLHKPGQTLTDITMGTLDGMRDVLHRVQPAAVLVQGDTTTTFASALAAFYQRTPVVHLEAGLRTDDRYAPYPEEINRRLTTQLCELHLAPTGLSAHNLISEGVPEESVIITGNTVIDALQWALARHGSNLSVDDELRGLDAEGPLILVTAHRRENWGAPMERIARALRRIALEQHEANIVVPMHRNPIVRRDLEAVLGGLENVSLIEPLPYLSFARLMAAARLILTDSGGVQEEAPSLGVPVLVLREVTERPEAVAAGCAQLVGTDESVIGEAALRLLRDPKAHALMARAASPFGDGRAATRCREAIEHLICGARRPEAFAPNGGQAVCA